MRILHITDRFYPPRPDEGGAPRFLSSLVSEQQRRGHQVVVGTSALGCGADVLQLDMEASPSPSLFESLATDRPDIVHFHALSEKIQPSLTRDLGIPSVVHVHGSNDGIPVNGTNPIYVSKQHAALHGSNVYVYNGIDVSGVPFIRDASDCLVFLGKVRRSKKGADTAVAVAHQTGKKLKLIGGRKLSIPETWLPWQQRIKSLGVLGGEQKFFELGNASALLFPVRWDEPFGLVLIEAMACGTPVIGFNRGAVSEIVEHGVTGFVIDNVDEMCEAVTRIDEIDRAACRQHVKQHFSIERSANAVMDLYQRVIAGESW